ncbi:MAG: hypothetical protein ACO213_10340 [Steroidobacteraceae bacterium]
MTHKIKLSAVAGAVVLALGAQGALAAAGHGGPQGPHDYQLNIIGVEKGKKARMTNNDRRTIFVPLKSTKTGQYSKPNFNEDGVGVQTAIVDSKIWLVPGDSFAVCDGNGFDMAYGCDDTYLGDWSTTVYTETGEAVALVDTRIGAVFQLPCNTNLNGEYWDSDGDGKIESNGDDAELDNLVSCNEAVDEYGNTVVYEGPTVPDSSYEIWARALGKPGGSAVTTTCATVNGELQCSLENVVMTRTKGKSVFAEVTDQMTSLVIGYCMGDVIDAGDYYTCDDGNLETTDDLADGTVEWARIALFAGNTQDWFWNYDNNGLRLAQLRFYTID